MEQKKNQWHPGFAAAIRMELKENREGLTFEEEHPLSKKPLQIDMLIIKNEKNVKITLVRQRYQQGNLYGIVGIRRKVGTQGPGIIRRSYFTGCHKCK